MMSEWIIRILIVLLACAGIVLYHFNPDTVSVVLWHGASLQLRLALVIICSFLTGALIVGCFLFLLRLRMRIQKKRLTRLLETAKNHQELLASARAHLALGDAEQARSMLAKVLRDEPDNVVALIQLAETHRQEGKLLEALKILEQARLEQKPNGELLLLAARINSELGNHTAAHDNAALLLGIMPDNRYALQYAANSADGLERYDQALGYLHRLRRATRGDEEESILQQIAGLETRAALKKYAADSAQKKNALNEVLRRHRDYAPALAELARLAAAEADLNSACKLWSRAYIAGGEAANLSNIAVSCLKANNPQQAIKTVENAIQTRAAAGKSTAYGQVLLAELYLQLEMVKEAEAEIPNIKPESKELETAIEVIRARISDKLGRHKEAFTATLNQLSRFSLAGTGVEFASALRPPEHPERRIEGFELKTEITPPRGLSGQ
ncbi:MAG TPA: lipopolysaccharide assembly protein LapA domain-containing protein [Oligoflexia bacterium]|nr:lipopolysaccharide assembly protein LapA domain-containing protein [Oligoflexia bacterium]